MSSDLNDRMDVDAAERSDGANVIEGGKHKGKGKEVRASDKNKGKEGNINMAKLILSRNKSNKSSKHKKRTEVAPAQQTPENNVKHYKRTVYECHHELYEDKDGDYVERWELPEEFTTTNIREASPCGSCQMNGENPWTTMNENQSNPDVLYKGKRVYSLRDMEEAEETGGDCPEPCHPQ